MNSELCRLCGKNSGLTDVFQEHDLWSKIFMCFGVKISKEDVITRKICKSCYFFTNSVFEFRLTSIAHDDTLRKESQPKPEIKPQIIVYPSEISQDAFLNTLNLASRNEMEVFKKPVFHPSVVRLKRKYPHLNIPKECWNVDVDPSVPIEATKIPKLDNNLGIWSVKKKVRGKQPDLILTRVRDESAFDSDSGSDSIKVKFNFKHSAIESPQSVVSPPPPKRKINRSKYPVYGARKSTRHAKISLQKKSPDNPKNVNETKKQNIPVASTTDDRVALKSLLQSDAEMNESLQNKPVDTVVETTIIEPPIPRLEDYDNLLVFRGEEVQTFICQTCNKIFDTQQLLNQHKKYSHKSSLRCTKCSKRFSIVETLMKHNLTCHAEPMKMPTKPEEKREIIKTVARKKTSGSIPIDPAANLSKNKNPDIILPAVNPTKNKNPDTILPAVNPSKNKNPDTILVNPSKNENPDTILPAANPIKNKNPETILPVADPIKNKNPDTILPAVNPSKNKNPDIIEYVISSDDEIEIEEKETKTATPEKPPNEISPQPAIENVINAALEPQKSTNSIDDNLIMKTALTPLIATSIKEKEIEKILEKKQQIPAPPMDEVFLIDDSDDETVKKPEETFVIDDTSGDSSKSKEIEANLPPISSRKRSNSNSSSLPSTSSNTLVENEANISQNIVVVPSAEDKEHMDATSSMQAKITNELSYVNYIFNKCSFVDKPKNDKKYLLKDIQRFTEKTYLPVEIIKSTGEEVTIEYGPMAIPRPGDKLAFWDTGHVIDVRKFDNSSKKTTVQPKPGPGGPDSQPLAPKTSVSQVLKSVRIPPRNTLPPTQQTISSTSNQAIATHSEITHITSNTKRAFLNSGEDLSKAMLLVPHTSNYQIVSNSPISFAKTNVVLPSVAVSKVQTTVSNLVTHSQAAKHNLMTMQSNQIAVHSKPSSVVSIYPKPVQTVSPSRGPMPPEPAKIIEQSPQLSTGYILMGITATQDGVIQPSANGPIIIGDLDDKIPKPLVINGMSYPSVTKIRNQQPSTIVLQPMVQETNVNIQNCINVRQDNSTNITEQFATLTLPVVIGSQSNNNQSDRANTLPAVMTTPQIQCITTSTSTSTDLAVLTPKPAIRIKNLSELRGENANMNTNQRNELHSLYTNALTNYVQNHSTTVATRSNTEEYLQIS